MRPIFKNALTWAIVATVGIPVVSSHSSAAAAAVVGNWHHTVRGEGSEELKDVVVNRQTNDVYFIGTTTSKPDANSPVTLVSNGYNKTAFVSKISLSGTVQWMKHIQDTTKDRRAEAIALGPDGSVYALTTEKLRQFSAPNHVRVTRYDAAGVQKWTRVLASATGSEVGFDLDVNASTVAVAYSTTGQMGGASRGLIDVVVTTLNSGTGAVVRTTQVGGGRNDFPSKIKFLSSGKILVAGSTNGKLFNVPTRSDLRTDHDFFWFVLNSDNSAVVNSMQWGTTSADRVSSLAVQTSGRFYVGGYSLGRTAKFTNRGEADALISGFTADGVADWTITFGTSDWDEITDLQPAPNSTDVLFFGTTFGVWDQASSGGVDMIGGSIRSTGEMFARRQLGTSGDDYSTGMSLRSDSRPVLAGSTSGSFDGRTPRGYDGILISAGTTLADFRDFQGAITNLINNPPRFIPVFPVLGSEQAAGEQVPDVAPDDRAESKQAAPLCNEVASTTVLYRREVATCAGLVVKAGTTTRIRLSLRNAAGVCSLSPRKRLKLTAPGTCKVKIRATQSNGSTKAVWITYTVS